MPYICINIWGCKEMMHNLELILLNIVMSKGILSTYFYTHPGLEYLDKYTWGKRLTLALIGPKYNFSLKLYLLIRGPFWNNISWCKVKIGNSAGKLRYPFPNHCVNLVKKSASIEPWRTNNQVQFIDIIYMDHLFEINTNPCLISYFILNQ